MVLVFSGMWTVFFCFCLSLEPDQEGLDGDATKTRARVVVMGVVLIQLTQILESLHCCSLIKIVWRERSPKRAKICYFLLRGEGLLRYGV